MEKIKNEIRSALRIKYHCDSVASKELLKDIGEAMIKAIKSVSCNPYILGGTMQNATERGICKDKDEHCYCCCPYGIQIAEIRRVFGVDK